MIRMRIPAISDTSGARLKVMFMAVSFLEKSGVYPWLKTMTAQPKFMT
jgi:hypothetical protein